MRGEKELLDRIDEAIDGLDQIEQDVDDNRGDLMLGWLMSCLLAMLTGFACGMCVAKLW